MLKDNDAKNIVKDYLVWVEKTIYKLTRPNNFDGKFGDLDKLIGHFEFDKGRIKMINSENQK